jgi:hypothetical protein
MEREILDSSIPPPPPTPPAALPPASPEDSFDDGEGGFMGLGDTIPRRNDARRNSLDVNSAMQVRAGGGGGGPQKRKPPRGENYRPQPPPAPNGREERSGRGERAAAPIVDASSVPAASRL